MPDNKVIHKLGPFTTKGDDWGTKEYWEDETEFKDRETEGSFWLCHTQLEMLFPIVGKVSSFNVLFWKNPKEDTLLIIGKGLGFLSTSLRIKEGEETKEIEVNPEWVDNISLYFPWHVTVEPLSYVTHSDS